MLIIEFKFFNIISTIIFAGIKTKCYKIIKILLIENINLRKIIF